MYRHYENKHCLLAYLVGRHWAGLCFRLRVALHNAALPRLHQAMAAVGEASADDLVPVMQAANPRPAHLPAVVSTLLGAARNPLVDAQHLPLLTDSDGNVRCFSPAAGRAHYPNGGSSHPCGKPRRAASPTVGHTDSQ